MPSEDYAGNRADGVIVLFGMRVLALLILLAGAADTESRLDQAVREAAGEKFWGVVLFARDGKPLLAKGYGASDFRKRKNTPRTLFDIASVSKPITAAAILQLERDGVLGIGDSIAKHLTMVPPDKADITIDHLLTHTAGFPEKINGLTVTVALDREAFSAAMMRTNLIGKPGQRFAYSNKGYCLLAVIVERASGMKFEEYVRKRVFAPAGMTSTGFYGDRSLDRKRLSSRAGSGDARTWPWDWSMRGSGGVVSSAEDLLKWDRELRKPGNEKLFEPHLEGFARGWMVGRVDQDGKPLWVFHTGKVHGYQAYFARWLDRDQVLIVLTNEKTDPRALHGPLLAAVEERKR